MNQAFERPFRPVEIADTTVKSFTLSAMADQLMSEESIEHSGRTSLSLARGKNMTVVLMVMKEKAVLHEHKAPGPITISTLKGHIEFTAQVQSEPLLLQAGDAAICAPHLPHQVKALEDSAFLLVIGGRTE